MKWRRSGQPKRKRRRDRKRRARKTARRALVVSKLPLINGNQSGSPMRLESLSSVAQVSHKKVRKRTSRSSSTKQSTSHSQTTQQDVSCGEFLSRKRVVCWRQTSSLALLLTSQKATPQARSKRLARTCWPNSAKSDLSSARWPLQSLLGHYLFADALWMTSGKSSKTSPASSQATTSADRQSRLPRLERMAAATPRRKRAAKRRRNDALKPSLPPIKCMDEYHRMLLDLLVRLSFAICWLFNHTSFIFSKCIR